MELSTLVNDTKIGDHLYFLSFVGGPCLTTYKVIDKDGYSIDECFSIALEDQTNYDEFGSTITISSDNDSKDSDFVSRLKTKEQAINCLKETANYIDGKLINATKMNRDLYQNLIKIIKNN